MIKVITCYTYLYLVTSHCCCAFQRELADLGCGTPQHVSPIDAVNVGSLWVLLARIPHSGKATMVRVVKLHDKPVYFPTR